MQGVTKPDFVIWGTNLEMASNKADDEYLTKSGTSFAAPMLSGLTGLLWETMDQPLLRPATQRPVTVVNELHDVVQCP